MDQGRQLRIHSLKSYNESRLTAEIVTGKQFRTMRRKAQKNKKFTLIY